MTAFSLFQVYHSASASLVFFLLKYLRYTLHDDHRDTLWSLCSLTLRLYVLLISVLLAAGSIILYALRYRTVVV